MQFTQKDIDRFWSHVDRSGTHGEWNGTPCWIWTGAHHKRGGYGDIRVNHKTVLCSRMVYEITYGIPKGMNVLHHCDNPPCVNPLHLFAGTTKDNSDDMIAKGRARHPGGDLSPAHLHPETVRGEKNPSAKLTEAQIIEIRSIPNINKLRASKQYGVSRTLIRKIIQRVIWKHI